MPSEDVERIGGVQFVVAQILPQVAVDLVGARLDDGVHDGSVAAPEFGGIGVGFDLELGDGVDRRLHHIGRAIEDVAQIRIVVDSVQQKIILQRARTVGAEAVCSFDARSGLGGSHAHAKQSELRIIASVQRKRVDALRVHHLAEFRGLSLQLRTFARNCHDFGCHARLQIQVHAHAILYVHLHRFSHRLLESLLLDRDCVTADLKRTRDIFPSIVGGKGHRNAAIDIGHGDLRSRDHRAARVAHQAYNSSGIFLRPQWCGRRKEHKRKEDRKK